MQRRVESVYVVNNSNGRFQGTHSGKLGKIRKTNLILEVTDLGHIDKSGKITKNSKPHKIMKGQLQKLKQQISYYPQK